MTEPRLLRCVVRICVSFLLLLVLLRVARATETVHYAMSFERANSHLIDITVETAGLDGHSVSFAMPYWAPGVYIVEEFAANIQNVEAFDSSGHALPWHKTDGQTWQVNLQGANSVSFHYKLFANGMPFRGAQLDERHVALTGAATWMYMVEGKDRPADLRIDRSSLPPTWRVATGLTRISADRYSAENYDWFADCPIEIADFAERDFAVLGTGYHFVVHDMMGKQDFSPFVDLLKDVIERGVMPILAPSVLASGSPTPAPFADYYFLIHITPGFGAGVEHLNSTMITIGQDWGDHSPTDQDALSNFYEHKMDLIVHEFFHAWNVKRLRPRELGPFDYSRAVHTPSLWISEGLTNYFTTIALLRSGFWKPQTFLDHTARVITVLESEPGRKERSIADTSWDTWLGFRGGGSSGAGVGFANNLSNTNYSYYDGGQVLGILLDLEIRHATGNRKSLQDWLRLMYSRYALPKPGFEPQDAVKAASEIAGVDMSDFFRRYVTGKEPLPYETEFSYAGIQVMKTESKVPWLGLALDRSSQDGGYRVTNVIPGSPGDLGGVDRGDVLLAMDNTTLSSISLEKQLAQHHVGDSVVLTLAHHGTVGRLTIKTAANPYPIYELKPLPQQTNKQRELYGGLLQSP